MSILERAELWSCSSCGHIYGFCPSSYLPTVTGRPFIMPVQCVGQGSGKGSEDGLSLLHRVWSLCWGTQGLGGESSEGSLALVSGG